MGDLIQGIGDIFGANAQQKANSQAASQQAAAAQQAIAVEQQQYAQTRQDESPWRVSGEAALQQLGQLYGLNVPTGTYSDLPGGYAGNTGQPSTVPQASTPTSQSTKSFAGVSEGGISAQQAQSILSARPDVQDAYNNLSSETKGYFGNDPNNYAAYWYNKYGQAGGYQLSSSTPQPVSATGASSTTNTASTIPTDASGTAGASSSPFWASPDYAFTLQQGLAGVDAGAAAGGMLDSGATRKAEIQYAGNLASGQYDNYVSHLMGLSNSGQAAANTTAAAGQNTANQVAATTTTEGNNAAASSIASGNISAQEYSQLAGLGSSYGGNSGGSTVSNLMKFAGNAATFLGG